MAEKPPEDGRRVPRERNRAAIIDAVFSLVEEGKEPPGVEDVAERAGVSFSSVFRNFDGLADLQHRAVESFHDRFSHVIVVADADGARSERIRSKVQSRVGLYEAVGAFLRIARARSLDHEPLVEAVSSIRSRLAEQTRSRFATELRSLTPTEAANLGAFIDATTSPDAYEVLGAAHARTPRQVRSLWIDALDAVLTARVGDDALRADEGAAR